MSGSRTKSGCWTCRVRRKKCDEGKPACSSCVSRSLFCHGYGQRPAWMLGKDSWQQILDSEEARAIRNSAEKAYSRRRQNNSRAPPWSAGVLVQDLRHLAQPAAMPPLDLGTGFDRTWSNCTQTLRDCNYAPNYQYVHTFLDLIFPLQWGFYDLHRQPDRQWFFDTIVASEPIYHASYGLCVSFESGLKAGFTTGHCDVTPEVQSSRLQALRGLQPYIAEMQHGKLNQLSLQNSIHAIAVILLLSSLEIFGETEGSWEVHLNATDTVLDFIETHLVAFGQSGRAVGSIERLLASPTPTFETRALEFFVATYIWADILAEATHGLTYSKPRKFDYTPLLRNHLVDIRSIMGCDTSVMLAIKDINAFAAFTKVGQPPDASSLAEALTLRVQAVVHDAASSLSHAATNPESDSTWVTLIHAHASLIYLDTMLNEVGLATNLNSQETVTKCLELLELLPHRLFIRVCWPFAVAGCVAREDEHSRFRAVLQQVEQAGHVLGFNWKGLIIMEECWKLRREKPEATFSCQKTLQKMGARILLI